MNMHDVIQKPLITEKSSIGRDELNLATFAVDPRANKQEIKRAVESMFDVKVIGVRTMQQQGKKKRVGRVLGRRPRWKKAIVQLASGQSIEFFLHKSRHTIKNIYKSVKFTSLSVTSRVENIGFSLVLWRFQQALYNH